MSDEIVQELRDRVDIEKWHDAGLIDTYRPFDAISNKLQWGSLTSLIQKAADRIEELERELADLRRKAQTVFREVEQTLGKALGYPPAFPDVSEIDDGSVVVGDHVPETLAKEAAKLIESLRRDAERWKECERLYGTGDASLEKIIDDSIKNRKGER